MPRRHRRHRDHYGGAINLFRLYPISFWMAPSTSREGMKERERRLTTRKIPEHYYLLYILDDPAVLLQEHCFLFYSRILGTNEGWPVSRILRHTVTGYHHHHHHQAGQAGKVLQSTPISGRPEYSSCLASLRMVVVVVVGATKSVT